jgi:hypothetical protein
MTDPLPKNGRRWHSVIGITESKHSRRIVPIKRSQKVFACGTRAGVLRTARPSSRGFDRLLPSRSCRDRGYESVPPIAGHNHPKLLRAPVRCRMRGHVPMQDSSRPNFQNDKHVDHPKGSRSNGKEIAGEHRSCVVPHEGRTPRLPSLSLARWSRRHVPSHGPRRDANAELDEELGGNPFLAPRPIRRGDRRDQLLRVHRNRRSTSRTRFPASEQSESPSVPANKRLRLDDG